jgi:hypothetical protein
VASLSTKIRFCILASALVGTVLQSPGSCRRQISSARSGSQSVLGVVGSSCSKLAFLSAASPSSLFSLLGSCTPLVFGSHREQVFASARFLRLLLYLSVWWTSMPIGRSAVRQIPAIQSQATPPAHEDRQSPFDSARHSRLRVRSLGLHPVAGFAHLIVSFSGCRTHVLSCADFILSLASAWPARCSSVKIFLCLSLSTVRTPLGPSARDRAQVSF